MTVIVAVNNSNTTIGQSSETGIGTWTQRIMPGSSTRWCAVIYAKANKKFLAASGGGSSQWGLSDDGHNWATITQPLANDASMQLGHSDALGITVGIYNTGSNNATWSNDLVTWNTVTAANFRPSSGNAGHGICYSPELTLFCAIGSASGNDQYTTSPDGKVWTENTTSGVFNGTAICWGGDGVGGGPQIFIGVGTGGNVRRSANGTSWTAETFATTPGNGQVDIAYAPSINRFVVVGSNGTVNTREGGSSTWTQRTISNHVWTSVCWSTELSLFIAVAGNQDTNVGFVATSPDGITWTDRTAATTNDWISVAVSEAGTASQAYTNPGGEGNRLLITFSGTGTGNIFSMVDGSITASSSYPGGWFWDSGLSNQDITLDFFAARIIDEAKWYQSNSATHGDWKWQGSMDDTSYTDIGTSFTLGGSTTQTQTQLNGNTTAYRFYRLHQVSGSTSNSPFLEEIEFKIDDASTMPGTGTTSYANPGGTGDRSRIFTTATAGGSTYYFKMLDGSLVPATSPAATPGSWFWNSGQSTRSITFDFFNKRVVDEAKWYQSTSGDSHGDWKWQGSNDNSAYTDIGTSFTLGGAFLQTHTQLNGNTTAWRYYRLLQTSGSTSNGPYLEEIEFRIDAATAVTDATTIAQTLTKLSQSVTVRNAYSTHISQTLAPLTQALLCSVSPVAHIAQTLQVIQQRADVQPGSNVIIQTLSALSQQANVNVASNTHITQTLQRLTQLLNAAAPVTATITQTLQKITQVATANTPPRFRIAQTLQKLTQLMQETEHVPHFVNAGTQQHFLSSTVTPSLPTGLVVGNLLIAFIYSEDTSTITATWPAGWTQIDTMADASGNAGGMYAYHYVTGGDTAPVVSMSAGSDFNAQINQYADVDDTYPVGNFQHTSGFSPDLMSDGLQTSGTNSLVVMWNTYRTDPLTDIPGYTLENRQTTSEAQAFFDVVIPNDGDSSADVDQIIQPSGNTTWQCFMFELLAPFEGVRVVMHPTEATDTFAGALFPTDKGDMNITEPKDTCYHPGDAIDPDSHLGWFIFFPPLASIAITEHADTAHFAVFTPPHATMNLTEFVDNFHGIGYVPGTATMDMTETADTFAAIGWVPGTADFNPTENKDRFLAIGLGATPPKRRRVFIVT